MIILVAGLILAGLGILAYVISQSADASAPAPVKKSRKAVVSAPSAAPVVDVARFEKRIGALQARLESLQSDYRDREKELKEKDGVIAELRRQVEQEASWRKREEEGQGKEKKRERLLQQELEKARDALTGEAAGRIRLEHELRDLKQRMEGLSVDLRQQTTRGLDFERKLSAAEQELGNLRRRNAELARKKEAEQWVAKDEYLKVKDELKKLRSALPRPVKKASEPPADAPGV